MVARWTGALRTFADPVCNTPAFSGFIICRSLSQIFLENYHYYMPMHVLTRTLYEPFVVRSTINELCFRLTFYTTVLHLSKNCVWIIKNTEKFQNKTELHDYMAMHFSRNNSFLVSILCFPIFHFLFVMIHKIFIIAFFIFLSDTCKKLHIHKNSLHLT